MDTKEEMRIANRDALEEALSEELFVGRRQKNGWINNDLYCTHALQDLKVQDPVAYKKFMSSLNRIEGHIQGVRRMIEEKNATCVDVITQMTAVLSMVKGFNRDVFALHIKNCDVPALQAGNTEVADEIVALTYRMMKNDSL